MIFAEISIFKISLGLQGVVQQLIHFIFLIIFTIVCAWLYYKSRDKVNGFLLGVILLLVANVLDLIITIPFFTGDYAAFYLDPYLWAGFFIVIITAGIYDLARKK